MPEEGKKVAKRKTAPRKRATAKSGAAPKTSKGEGTPAAKKPVSKRAPRATPEPKNARVDSAGDFASLDCISTEAAFPVVALGASAGGLEAFEAFFKAMPADSGMAFVMIAHLDPTHVSLLPELVQKSTAMRVRQIRESTKIEPNSVYVIPPNRDLSILDSTLHLTELSQPRGSNLPIDNFFRSLAADQGANAIGIVLSGTGTDGSHGVKAIKGGFGMVMAQDEKTAKYDGMPRSAVATGLVDFILPPGKMPRELVRYARRALGKMRSGAGAAGGHTPDAPQQIFLLLRARTGHDFSLYKKNTICRRIERRMSVHQLDEITDYVRFLKDNEREVDILFKELLIGVTSFFRDPAAFEALKEKVVPGLLAGKPDGYTVRVWVPGCSSGEEAYSVAIAIHESMDPMNRCSIQVFGTDIDETAIDWARSGLYPASILPDVGPERLKRYFTEEDSGQYRIKKIIREMLVFAPQNVIKDPPFTKLDLLSCRNLLIYLGPELQQRLIPLFHYSLKPDGFLFLGTSESLGQAAGLFKTCSKKWKIFQRNPAPVSATMEFPARPWSADGAESRQDGAEAPARAEDQGVLRLVEAILAQSSSPPCVIIDDMFDMLYVHGHTGKFLEPAQGRASVNALKMARPGLKAELAAAVRAAAANRQEVVQRGLRVEHDGVAVEFDLVAKPVAERGPLQGLIMVAFQERPPAAEPPRAPAPPTKSAGRGKRVQALERELKYTKDNLQKMIGELEISNEEFKSTNEELQSTNEELQSTNEELETSKEELQSLNEETVTVNVELQNRIDELSKANDDLKNLLDSTSIATIFLDIELRVRRFTPAATSIIPLAREDIGRAVQHFASRLKDFDLAGRSEEVLASLACHESEALSLDNRIYTVKIRPYRTLNNIIDGVVLTFQDVTDLTSLAEAAKALAAERDFVSSVIDSVKSLVLVLDYEGRIVRFNNECRTLTGRSEADVLGRYCWDVLSDGGRAELARAEFTGLRDGPFPSVSTGAWLAGDASRHSIRWCNTCIADGASGVLYVLRTGQVIEQPADSARA